MVFKASPQSNSSVSINKSQLTTKDREMISLLSATRLIKLDLKLERDQLERLVVLLEEIKIKTKTSNNSRAAQVDLTRMLLSLMQITLMSLSSDLKIYGS